MPLLPRASDTPLELSEPEILARQTRLARERWALGDESAAGLIEHLVRRAAEVTARSAADEARKGLSKTTLDDAIAAKTASKDPP